jgi:hypothetical protein
MSKIYIEPTCIRVIRCTLAVVEYGTSFEHDTSLDSKQTAFIHIRGITSCIHIRGTTAFIQKYHTVGTVPKSDRKSV